MKSFYFEAALLGKRKKMVILDHFTLLFCLFVVSGSIGGYQGKFENGILFMVTGFTLRCAAFVLVGRN